MKASCLAVFLYSAGLAFGQFALAPNPACANNAPYCRMQVGLGYDATNNNTPFGVGVIGFYNGILYGAQVASNGTICPGSGSQTTNALCFYTTSTLTTENWTYRGQYSYATSGIEYPIEIVFAPGTCSSTSYKYIYTGQNRILRATSSLTDWNFIDVAKQQPGFTGLPQLPVDAATRPNSFAIGNNSSGGMRLFYGNYSAHGMDNNGNPDPPFSYIWHSDDCGNTWSNPLNLGGSEVHAINVDPANPLNIYATVDVETLSNTFALGLWRSTNGGDSFSLLTPNSPYVGIDFVFPSASGKLFLETDGAGGEPNGGPLLSQDKVSGDAFQVVANWPSIPAFPTPTPAPWAGSGGGIALTSDQNIFLATSGEGGAFGPRNGIWYFAPPYYNSATLLEDLAPPIQSITANGNGTATVTTLAPHGIQTFDTIQISGAPSAFNTQTPAPVTVTGPNTFIYSCTSNCTGSGTAGYATKNIDWVHSRTVEATDTCSNREVTPPQPCISTTYLYHSGEKIPKPAFLIWNGSGPIPAPTAAAGSSLAGFVNSSGITYLLYANASNHMETVAYVNGGWQATDLSVLNGTAAPVSPIIQISPGSFYYFDGNGKINGVYAPGADGIWHGSGPIPAPTAAAGSSLAGFVNSSGITYLLYANASNHMETVAYVNGGWQATDLSVLNGTAAPVSPIIQISPGSFYYFDGNGKINGVYAPGADGIWHGSGPIPAPTAAAGSSLAGFVNSSGITYLLYANASNHMETVAYVNGGWQATDLSVLNGTAAPVSPIIQISPGSFYYFDGNGKINGVYAPGADGIWHGSGPIPAPTAAAGSSLAGFVNSSGITYLLYANASNHMETVAYVNGGWQATDLSVANGTANPTSQIIQLSPGNFYFWDANGKVNGVYAP